MAPTKKHSSSNKEGGKGSDKKDKIDKNERKRKRDQDTSNVEQEEEVVHSKSKSAKFDDSDEGEGGGGGAAEISLSIEETNKLREKLGLAPLQLDDKPKEVIGEDGKTESVYTKDGVEFVHKPAENWSDKKSTEKLREKLEAQKEKRKIQEKLSHVKLLSTAEADNDSAAAWVNKSRKLEQEKALAIQRAKALEEMDKDFGVGNIIDSHMTKKPVKNYSSRDLGGLTVQHSVDAFTEGRETVLVLQDKDVLDEGEEVLINPSLVDEEKWKKNIELRKKKPGYDPFDEEFDEFGNLKAKKLLGKYDEVIGGEQRDSFRLGSEGTMDVSYEKLVADRLKAKLREGAVALDLKPAQLANEYYTKEEMEKFKKPKKKVKKLRKSNALKADDLLASAEVTNEDYGSRVRGKGRKKDKHEEDNGPGDTNDHDMDNPFEKFVDETDDTVGPDEDLSNFVVEDEAENELQSVLHRTRLIKQCEQKDEDKKLGAEKIIQMVEQIKEEPMDETTTDEKSSIVLNTISEYCRGLGDIPTYGLAGNRDDVDDVEADETVYYKIEPEPAKASTSTKPAKHHEKQARSHKPKGGKWVEAEFDEQDRLSVVSSESSGDESETNEREPILDEEPDVTSGVAAALKLALRKGYLEKADDGDHGPSKLAHLEAQRFTIVDKQFHDIDDKYAKKLERMGGYGGPVSDFKEKSNYDPNVKLEYADEKGNLMDAKEAFRYMSWKFHGKVPGKRKVEKRTKKHQEKRLKDQMSSTDTPLGTLGKQIDKQRQLQLPYIVLSGAGSKDVGTAIKKD